MVFGKSVGMICLSRVSLNVLDKGCSYRVSRMFTLKAALLYACGSVLKGTFTFMRGVMCDVQVNSCAGR